MLNPLIWSPSLPDVGLGINSLRVLSLTDMVEALDHLCRNMWSGHERLDFEEKDCSMLFLIFVFFN